MTAALTCSILSLSCCRILCFLVSGVLFWLRCLFLLERFLGFTSAVKMKKKGTKTSQQICSFDYYKGTETDIKMRYWVLWMVTVRFSGGACLLAAKNGSGGGLQWEKLQPPQRSLLVAHLHPWHLLLVHFLLHLLKKVWHFHLFAVPQAVALRRDKRESSGSHTLLIYCTSNFQQFLLSQSCHVVKLRKSVFCFVLLLYFVLK